MMRILIIALLVALPAPILAGPAPDAAPQGAWNWTGSTGDSRPVTVRIVRGSYRIVRGQGPVTVAMKVHSAGGGPAPLKFDVEDGDRLIISDVYPASGFRSWKECLPPQDARGDFWASDAVIDAVIHAPQSVEVRVEVMDPRAPQELSGAGRAV